MRRAFPILVWAACGASPAPVPVVAPTPISNATKSCSEAAVGLERSTKSIRAPEQSVVQPIRARCTEDLWPAVAIDCFATMHEGELGHCAAKLADRSREAMFAALGGGENDRTAIAIAQAKLETMQVGVAECDQFIATVRTLITCEQLPVETRAVLGRETADVWDLPASGLPIDAQRKMAEACNTSLVSLQQQALGAGCMP